ncbi:hypothetical protein PTKIN_Ptkin09bG0136700 [Pterospermum kingtungense]
MKRHNDVRCSQWCSSVDTHKSGHVQAKQDWRNNLFTVFIGNLRTTVHRNMLRDAFCAYRLLKWKTAGVDGNIIKVKMATFGWQRRRRYTNDASGNRTFEMRSGEIHTPNLIFKERDYKSYREVLLWSSGVIDDDKGIPNDKGPIRRMEHSAKSIDDDKVNVCFNTMVPKEESERLLNCVICDFKDPCLTSRVRSIMESTGVQCVICPMGLCQMCLRFDSKKDMEDCLVKVRVFDPELGLNMVVWNDHMIKKKTDIWILLGKNSKFNTAKMLVHVASRFDTPAHVTINIRGERYNISVMVKNSDLNANDIGINASGASKPAASVGSCSFSANVSS